MTLFVKARSTAFEKECEYCKNNFVTWPGQNKRFCSIGCGYKNRTSPPIDNLLKSVKRDPSGCLVFIKSRYPNGYGRVGIGNNKHQLAHRFIWEYHNGPIPKGMCALHKCDNPPCCEISHLFLGTLKDNSQDMISKGRQAQLKGSDMPNAKLNEEKVLFIKQKLKEGAPSSELATLFNVHPETIRGINRKSIWRHVEGEPVKMFKSMPHGSKQYFAKLNEEKVKDILILLKNGVPGNQLAKKYGVNRGTIYGIKKGVAWRHVSIS